MACSARNLKGVSSSCLACSTCDKTSNASYFSLRWELDLKFTYLFSSQAISPRQPCRHWRALLIVVKRDTSITRPSSRHTHLSPPPYCFSRLPCANIIFLSQDLWNASFPSLLLSKDRCSLPKQVCRTDWASASVAGIKSLDLPLSTN